MKISKKNILFFILGFLTYFALTTVLNWEESKEDFIQGWNDGREATK